MKPVEVAIVVPYSFPSACGIWKRAYDDIVALHKTNKYQCTVLSSDILKGTTQRLPHIQAVDDLQIYRFRKWFSLGGGSMFFFHFLKLIKLRPDIIHTHGYRHPHSLQSLIIGKLLRKKVFLTAHAPFEKDKRRSVFMKAFDWLYDHLIGWWEIRLYDKIIMTTKWEEKYLQKLGASSNTLAYVPNGIDKVFLQSSQTTPFMKSGVKGDTSSLRVFYMGRIDPVKQLEWIIRAAHQLPHVFFHIYGPLSGYKTFASDLKNVDIKLETYTKEDFLKTAKKFDLYVLPSARESFGMTMLEAMSQGCVVISSNTRGAQEFIKDGVNGFIAKNEKEFVQKIAYVEENKNKLNDIKHNAIETAKQYNAEDSGTILISVYDSISN